MGGGTGHCPPRGLIPTRRLTTGTMQPQVNERLNGLKAQASPSPGPPPNIEPNKSPASSRAAFGGTNLTDSPMTFAPYEDDAPFTTAARWKRG